MSIISVQDLYLIDLPTLDPYLKTQELGKYTDPVSEKPITDCIQTSYKAGYPFIAAVVIEKDESNKVQVFLFEGFSFFQKGCASNPLTNKKIVDVTLMFCLPKERRFRPMQKSLFEKISEVRQVHNDHPDGHFMLATRLKDDKEANLFPYFMKQAAKRGHKSAEMAMAQLQPLKQEKWLIKAAQQRDPEAVFSLAELWARSKQKRQAGVSLYFEAAEELNHAESQYRYGLTCEGKKVYLLAHKWYKKAMDNGHCRAMYRLGVCCLKGLGVKNKQEYGFSLIQKAADAGIAQAMLQLAYCYQKGLACTPSKENYLQWIEAAALKSLPAAQMEFARQLELQAKHPQALEWLEIASTHGLRAATRKVYEWYAKETSVAFNREKAKSWLEAVREPKTLDICLTEYVSPLAEGFAESFPPPVQKKPAAECCSELEEFRLFNQLFEKRFSEKADEVTTLLNDYLYYRNAEARLLIGRAIAFRKNYLDKSKSAKKIEELNKDKNFLYASFSAPRFIFGGCACKSKICNPFADCETLFAIFNLSVNDEQVIQKIKKLLTATYGTYQLPQIHRIRADAHAKKAQNHQK